MIRESTIAAVYPLAEKLASRGIRVTPMQTSPVEQLVHAGHLPIPSKNDEELISSDPAEAIIDGSLAKDAMGACKHDLTMDELVDVISGSVKGSLDVARNVVNPIILEVTEEAEQYMRDAESVRKTHISVIPNFYADAWNSPTLSEMVERYSETAVDDLKLTVGVPYEMDMTALKELAHTGARRFDEEIDDLFDSMGYDQVFSVYSSLFSIDSTQRRLSLSEVVSVNGQRNHVLLCHLFARKLIQDPPEGTGVSLEGYRSYMAQIISQSGRVIYRVMARREVDRNRRQLIKTWPQNLESLGERHLEIHVNGDVYNQWLKEGGEPEVLMGALVSDNNSSYGSLLEEKDRYLKEWERRERVLGTSQRLNRFNNGVDGLRMAIARQINELDEELLPVPRNILHERLEKELHKLYGKFYESMYEYARRIVCDALFPHTDALKILCAIDNVVSDYPDIEIREAALLATIEVVSQWVAKLCKVEYFRVPQNAGE